MLRQIGKRLVTVIPSLIGVVIVTFLLTRVLPGDTCGLFRRAGGERAGDRGHPQAARPRQAAAGAVRAIRRRSRPWRLRQVADDRTAGHLRHRRASAGIGGTHLGGAHRRDADRGAARHSRRGQAGFADRPRLPRDRDRGRVAAGVLHRAAAHLCLLLQARLVAATAGAPRASTTPSRPPSPAST